MTLTTLAKISAAYLGLMVIVATASVVWENGRDLATHTGLFKSFTIAESSTSG